MNKNMKKIRGLTLYEVLVTLALFSVLLTIITSVSYKVTKIQLDEIKMSRLVNTAAIVMELISADIMTATNILPKGNSLTIVKPNQQGAGGRYGIGNLIINYELSENGTMIRNTTFSSKDIAYNVSKFNATFESHNPPIVKVLVEVKDDLQDSKSKSFLICTSVAPRPSLPTFGP